MVYKTVFEECLLETSLMTGSWTEEIVSYMRKMTDSIVLIYPGAALVCDAGLGILLVCGHWDLLIKI